MGLPGSEADAILKHCKRSLKNCVRSYYLNSKLRLKFRFFEEINFKIFLQLRSPQQQHRTAKQTTAAVDS